MRTRIKGALGLAVALGLALPATDALAWGRRRRARSRAAAAGGITVGSMPRDIAAFVAMRDKLAKTPEGGAAVFATALALYCEDPRLGRQALTVAYHRSRLQEGGGDYRGWGLAPTLKFHLSQTDRRPYLGRSYFAGATPENGYQPTQPLTVHTSRNRFSDLGPGKVKVFLTNGGADQPRPLAMQVNSRGIWKAVNASSMYLGVRSPAAAPVAGGGVPDDGDDL